jgi:hypothetical protein
MSGHVICRCMKCGIGHACDTMIPRDGRHICKACLVKEEMGK